MFLWDYAGMRTTVDVPDELMRRVKAVAATRGLKLKEFVEAALREALNDRHGRRRPHRVRLPLIPGSGKAPIEPSREELDAALWD